METYDPAENPRYLPTITEVEVETPRLDIDKAREELVYKNQALQIMQMEGWAHIAYTAEMKRQLAQSRGLRAESLDELRRAQGEIAALDWLLQLPAALHREQQNLRTYLAQNETDEDGPGD